MAFQTQINLVQAPAVEGDIASANPRFAVPTWMDDSNGAGNQVGWRAAPGGVFIARFAWADLATGQLLANTGTGLPTGFIARTMNGLNMQYFLTPSSTSYFIPQGFGIGDVFSGGTFWVRHRPSAGTPACAVGMSAFAKLADGTIQFALSTATIAGWVKTKWIAGMACAANELTKMTSQPLG
jgi:hypothetical protein